VQPVVLTCIEKVFTGQMPTRTVGAGECTEIATGAPMPPGSDAVVMVEQTSADGAHVSVFNAADAGQNIGRKGADIRGGQTVLRAGEMLNASRIGAIAALGAAQVEVYGRPRVAILSTGNEIVDPGRPLLPGQIYDINRFPCRIALRQIRWPTSSVRSTNRSKTMCSCSRVEPQWANAT
jgi:molybdopterin biosynthesis enzyme